MTPEQMMRIDQLRLEGFGYKTIARQLKIPLNTVKSYVRRIPMLEREETPRVIAIAPRMLSASKA